MNKINLLLFTVTFLCFGSVKAQETSPCVIVEMTSGEKVEFLLQDQPKLRHSDDKVLFYTNKTLIEYKTTNISKVYYGDTGQTAIQSVEPSSPKMKLSPETIRLSNLIPGESVHLYSVDGAEQTTMMASDKGDITFSLSTLPQGVYVIKTRKQSFKVAKQ